MEDEKIIELFEQRSELAISELSQKYGKVLSKISYNIVQNLADVEECLNDSYLGVWNKIPPEHPNPLLTYVCKIVRNISLKSYRKNTTQKRDKDLEVVLDELEEVTEAVDNVEKEIENKELIKYLNKFLETLPVENRVIFLRRYWYCESYKDIGVRVGLSEKNVSVKLTRIRKELKKYLENEGVVEVG